MLSCIGRHLCAVASPLTNSACTGACQVPRLTTMLRAFGAEAHTLDVAALFIQRSQALLQTRQATAAAKVAACPPAPCRPRASSDAPASPARASRPACRGLTDAAAARDPGKDGGSVAAGRGPAGPLVRRAPRSARGLRALCAPGRPAARRRGARRGRAGARHGRHARAFLLRPACAAGCSPSSGTERRGLARAAAPLSAYVGSRQDAPPRVQATAAAVWAALRGAPAPDERPSGARRVTLATFLRPHRRARRARRPGPGPPSRGALLTAAAAHQGSAGAPAGAAGRPGCPGRHGVRRAAAGARPLHGACTTGRSAAWRAGGGADARPGAARRAGRPSWARRAARPARRRSSRSSAPSWMCGWMPTLRLATRSRRPRAARAPRAGGAPARVLAGWQTSGSSLVEQTLPRTP
jgi:hypothetical protein